MFIGITKIKKGFTLIELLVVIAIIGVLSSIAVINISNSKEKSRQYAMFDQMERIQSLVNICVSTGETVCSDCTSAGVNQWNIETGKQICGGQTWPAPVAGWQWSRYTIVSVADKTWAIDTVNNADTLVISCGNRWNRLNCEFYEP